jgi:hypothetical protein
MVDDDIDPFDLHDGCGPWRRDVIRNGSGHLSENRSYKIDPRLPKHKKEAADYTGGGDCRCLQALSLDRRISAQ